MTNDVKAAAAATPAKKSDASLAFWFTVSGWIGTALFYVVYEYIHSLGDGDSRPQFGVELLDSLDWATLAWTGSYLLSILWQHALHRYLVFGAASPYLSSLVWTYISYTLSIVLSSGLSLVFVSYLGVHHRISFVLTLVITGVLNFHTLKNAFEAPSAAVKPGQE